jgi:uncharacterized protein (TIGR03382 family)
MSMARILALGTLALAASHASAGMVYINSPLAPIASSTATSGQAKFRFSNSNWDQSLDRGTGTTSGNFISAHIGNYQVLNNREFHFSLSHTPGQGFVFSVLNTNNGTTTTLAWGTFPSLTNATAQTPQINGVSPTAAFNGLLIEARATRANSVLSFRELSFTGPSLTVANGAFVNGYVAPGVNGPGDSSGFHNQEIVANTNLANHAWTFSGLISATRDSSSAGDEEVKFTVGTRQYVTSIPIPTPGAAALAGLAGVALLRRRRA